jgi:glycosyltransferase involved in cell wall biosynthesis
MQLEEMTVIVPTRNEMRNITAFLRSLPSSMGLIVVDASTDDTPNVVMRTRPHNTVVLRDPGNVTQARQLGAEAAHSPWLLFSDADVTFASEYFELVATYGDCDALYGPKLSADGYQHYYHLFSLGQHISHNLGITAASGSNMLVRRDVFWRVGGFDLRLNCNEDSELIWRVKRSGYRVCFAPDLRVYARDHRRLERGRLRKTVHSVLRCALLYSGLMPERWRGSDWGYWSAKRQAAE